MPPPVMRHPDRRARPFTAWATIPALLIVLAGCATQGNPDAPRAPSVPSTAPSALGPALRCMDGLLLERGVRDLTLAIDSAPTGDREARVQLSSFLSAAVSDITQRSRAIRLVVPEQAVTRSANPDGPANYTVRGTLELNGGTTPQGKAIGLDLTLIDSTDMSVVPGTSRHNDIYLRTGPATFTKFGQPFSVAAATTATGAARALVELSTIELIGRVTRVPYWSCFGVDNSNAAVNAEIQDWYDALAARPRELIAWFQSTMGRQQLYDGPVDGGPNAAFREAVAGTREALGQPRETKLSLEFFKAWVLADAGTIANARATLAAERAAAAQAAAAPQNPGQPSAGTPPQAYAAPPAAAGPVDARPASGPLAALPPAGRAGPAAASRLLTLQLAASNENGLYARGEPVALTVRPNRDAHVYCFLHDEKRRIVRFFPNRFQRDSRVEVASGLSLPGAGRFELVMNPRGISETVACFATDRDVLAELPAGVAAGDLVPLKVTSLEQVKAAFINVSGGALAHESIELRAK